ncbi:F-box only protein 21-like [Camponotus floridanus]|uniref:F-box only protein 21-like n=1 Tax=Camponotus floridanus TaxID=104421 RepID=UPI000DC6C944|nr:F-box only protein 21-like [Camponotus floridanus]
MAMLIHMPTEIVFKILEYKDITIKDIVNFSSTSKQFRQLIINDKNLWRKKFIQRWPSVKKYYEEDDKDFYEADITNVQSGMKCAKELWAYVSHMSEKHYYYVNNHKYVDEFSSLFSLHKDCSNAHSMHCAILKDEFIRSIYTQSPWECDLTHRYYSMKLFRCWLKKNFERNWKKFINKPHQQQILEKIIRGNWIKYVYADPYAAYFLM